MSAEGISASRPTTGEFAGQRLQFSLARENRAGVIERDADEVLSADLDPLDRAGIIAVLRGADWAIVSDGGLRVQRATARQPDHLPGNVTTPIHANAANDRTQSATRAKTDQCGSFMDGEANHG